MILQDLIAGIAVDTTWGPPIYVDDPFSPKPPGEVSPASYLKPKFTLYVRGGGAPVVLAPYGDPGETRWPWVQGGATFAVLGVVGLILWRLSK